MIIRCPECRTGYSVKQDQIYKEGRTVRCSQCSHSWHQKFIKEKVAPAEEKPQAPLAPKPDDLKNDPPETIIVPIKSKKPQIIAISIFVFIALFMSVLLLAQNFFEETFPGSKGFYSAIGLGNEEKELTESDTGLSIPKEKVERTLEDGEPLVLTFKGVIVNTNSVAVNIPKIIITLHDDKGVEIDRWPAHPEKKKLEPGEETTWTCRFFNPELDSVAEHRIRFK